MRYTGTVPFTGDTSRAFDMATAALTPVGFRVSSRDKASLNLSGPGLRSTKQAAILGASSRRCDAAVKAGTGFQSAIGRSGR